MTSSQPSDAGRPSDIDLLHHTFPEWNFGTFWITSASGPDRRRLTAIRGGVILSAWDADSLAAQITAETIAAALRDDES